MANRIQIVKTEGNAAGGGRDDLLEFSDRKNLATGCAVVAE